jgi:N-acylneuraminate cytidylyltransferase/CMP-N,N'-diacetyllegionaminic acid synthase
MIGDARVLAIVPARRGSKGLPLKNVRPLGGKPLLAWPIGAARGSRHVDRVIISTDCPEFAAAAVEAGADAPFLRPEELASDSAPSAGFIRHAIETLEAMGDKYDYVLLLEPTSPLTESADIDAALATLASRRDEADSIVGVTELTAGHPEFAVRMTEQGLLRPLTAPSFGAVVRRQDAQLLYGLDGSLYASDIKAFQREGTFYHDRTLPFVTPRWKSLEVDDLIDLICIEAILSHRDLIRDFEQQGAA